MHWITNFISQIVILWILLIKNRLMNIFQSMSLIIALMPQPIQP